MLQSVSRNTQPNNVLYQSNNYQSNVGLNNVQTHNKFSSQAHSAQSGQTGSNLVLNQSQQDLQMINTNQIYGFQQSSDQSLPNIYSTQLSTNISGPQNSHQQMQQQIPYVNGSTAFEQVNQLKQLHQRLLVQQMNNQARPQQPHSDPSSTSQSNIPFSAYAQSSGPHHDDTNLMQIPPNGLQTNMPPQQTALRPPQPQPDEVSANINQKLIQLKQQLEQQQQIQSQRQQIITNNGETKLQMQLRQHIIQQQRKSEQNSSINSSNLSSGKSSPKSSGAKRDSKQKKKVSFDYSSGDSSKESPKHSNLKRPYNKITKPIQEMPKPMSTAPVPVQPPMLVNHSSKFEMYDHSTSQKRRRLQTCSYKQNQVFHTSGNRLIPMLPKSILGVAPSGAQSSINQR